MTYEGGVERTTLKPRKLMLKKKEERSFYCPQVKSISAIEWRTRRSIGKICKKCKVEGTIIISKLVLVLQWMDYVWVTNPAISQVPSYEEGQVTFCLPPLSFFQHI
jgi:hypothetical protein